MLLAATVLLACSASGPSVPDGGSSTGIDAGAPDASEPDAGGVDINEVDAGPPDAGLSPRQVSVTVAKVKNLLTGLTATDEEVARVVADPAAMKTVVGEWMQLPEHSEVMLHFFVTAFQQDQWSYEDLALQFCQSPPFAGRSRLFVQTVQESFARTALALNAEGKPFTTVATTTRFMMTPALMAAYAMLDGRPINDNYICQDRFADEHPVPLTVQSLFPTTFEEAVNPDSPNYMTFYDAGLRRLLTSCPPGTITYPAPVSQRILTNFLFNGFMDLSSQCYRPAANYLTDEDFSDWRMVEIRRPLVGENTTPAYDLPYMRTAQELLLRIPRVGFFTTPAFTTRWTTNNSNLARVQINQTLIVALGQPIDLTNTTAPASLEALDRQHAQADTTCYQCHQSLDPMRQFFRQTYSIYMGNQDDGTQRAMPGQFAFHGVTGSGTRIADLGALLAGHPMFASAWVQKLCTWATAMPCDEADPEFQRITNVFVSSQFSWSTMAQELFSSPLVTHFSPTESDETIGAIVPIARQRNLCATLSSRLGLTDVCGMDARTVRFSPPLKAIAASWPSYQFSRGAETPAVPRDASLMERGGAESLCALLADEVVDQDGSAYQSTAPDAAIDLLARRLMGLTSDRLDGPKGILRDHFQAGVEEGASPTDALKSVFVLACISPYVVALGQ